MVKLIRMAKHYVVDGYNVIFSTFLGELELQRAREILISFAGTYAPDVVTIVFDGRVGIAGPSMPNVIFTKGEKADDYIKRFVENTKDRGRIIVVTNDKSIIGYVRYLGAKTISPKQFLDNPPRRKSMEKFKGSLSESEKQKINRELKALWGIEEDDQK